MQNAAGDALGLYISIPFCRSKCTYCNFASGVYPTSAHDRYVDRLIADMANARTWAERLGVDLPCAVDSIYLGGGTPSLLAPELVTRLFAAIHTSFNIDSGAEITVECAPGQLKQATLHALVAGGANRVSLGVQSFIDAEARSSGRLHSRAVVLEDLRRLRTAGLTNINIDLIAGLAGQTIASWRESLQALIDTGVPHASVYMLEIDEDSRLGRELLAGGARYHAGLVPSDETIACMYELAIARLAEAGLEQYEISNFALAGLASRHNLRYWQRRPYLGVGLDASSALRTAKESEHNSDSQSLVRVTTTDNLESFLAGARELEITRLSLAQQHEEAWFLGLRLNAGVKIAEIRSEFGSALFNPAVPIIEGLVERGLVEYNAGTVRLTPQGRLLSNEVFQEFLKSEAEPAVVRR